MRFSEQTPELVFRRGRLDPEHQVQDIRNAITFLQSETGRRPQQDRRARRRPRRRPCHFGHGNGHPRQGRRRGHAGHLRPGRGREIVPARTLQTQAELIRLAREGAPPTTAAAARARNEQEARLALNDYKPFWRLDAIPQTAAVRFIIAETDDEIDNVVHARSAARELKGPNDVKSLTGALHKLSPSQTSEAAKLAAEWFKQRL